MDGKVVIITGGASGIGAESARLFTDHGAKVVIVDIQEELGQNTEIDNAVKFTIEKHGKLDVLFSNAGVLDTPGSILDLNLEHFDRVMAVNVRGAAAFIKHAARAMVASGTRGSIVCTTSVTAEIGGQGPHGYTASKHALLGLIKSACGDRNEETAKQVEGYCEAVGILKGVVLKPNHVAKAALFLASDDSIFLFREKD
uniref:3-oxoacyl-[acyl-carrier-protein] reductase n=1 Tax=Brassica campestris TaxID=3711 RepID=A0A3P5ZKG5_BRACM|nr:unnamed protein product [Brassica rapa]